MHYLMTSFCTTYLPNIVGTLIGTILGFWGAYLIYFLTNKSHRKEKKEFEKNQWEYFQYLLKNSSDITKINIELLGKKVDALTSYIFEIPPIEHKPNGDLRRILHGIDLEGIFHLYKKQFLGDSQNENFYQLLSTLDFIEVEMDLLKVVFENAIKNDFARRVDFNNSFIRAANRVDEIKQILFTSGKREEYLQVNKIINDYKGLKMGELETYQCQYNNLLSPIYTVLRNNISDIPYLKEIISDFEYVIFKYSLVIKGNEAFQKEIDEDKKQLGKKLEELNKLTEPLLKSNI